jgi:hypothetical protein
MRRIEGTMGNDAAASLGHADLADLQRIAGLMIPASDEYGVPPADDPAIFADVVRSLGRDLPEVHRALADLRLLAGGAFADLDAERAAAIVQVYLTAGGTASITLGRVILQCYYRDDRVVRSLGLEPRPPFPKGHTLEQGDWSLLDAVRGRKPLWRDDRGI